ncbi:MAG: TIGR00725 family protein [Candidatus Thermoplasmatota archaeon]
MIIGVIGCSDCERKYLELAESVGEKIAASGSILLCGGLSGVMESACIGAKKKNGVTVGILPGNDKSEANKYVDIAIVTGMGTARNNIIARTADVLIAIDGGYGTLSEIATALNIGKHVICLFSWDLAKIGKVENYHYVSTPEEAVKLALEIAKG